MTAVDAEPKLMVEACNGILLITLNRPNARNAVDLEVSHAIAEAIDLLDEDDELRVGVLAARGPVFCAGMDLKAFARGEIPRIDGRGFAGLVQKPPTKPLIAAVQGPAVGGGFELALACDLIVASEEARFALPEVTRGLTAAGGGLFRLPARVPYHRAMELILTGRMMTTSEATDLGLVSRVVPADEVLDAALELARTVADNAPLAVQASLRSVRESADWPSHEAFRRQEALSGPVRDSADAREGALAFAEKRAPVWKAQ